MPLALGYKHDSFADFFVTYIFFFALFSRNSKNKIKVMIKKQFYVSNTVKITFLE